MKRDDILIQLNMMGKAAARIGDKIGGHDFHTKDPIGDKTYIACHKCKKTIGVGPTLSADDLNNHLFRLCSEAAKPTRYDEMMARQKEKS